MSFEPAIASINGEGSPRLIVLKGKIYDTTGLGAQVSYASNIVILTIGGGLTFIPPLTANMRVLSYVEANGLYNPTYAKITSLDDTNDLIYIDAWTNGMPSITPVACTAAIGAAGNVNVGTHSYKIAFVIDTGETLGGVTSNQINITSSAKQVSLTAIATRPTTLPGTCTARKIYRTAAGDSPPYKLVGTIADNTTTVFTDNVADGSLGINAQVLSSAGGFIVDGYIADLPRCQNLTETFTPDTLVHGIWLSKKTVKYRGYFYQCDLDYSKYISADTLLLLRQHLALRAGDKVVLIPRVDQQGFQYNVYFAGDVQLSLFGRSKGHKGPAFRFIGVETIASWPLVSGYGMGYAQLYGTQL